MASKRQPTSLLSLVSHELRAPLNTINGFLDLTLGGMAGELAPQQRDFLLRARAGSEHLYALIEDLLLLARADAGELRLALAHSEVADIVTEAIEDCTATALTREIMLVQEVENNLPLPIADALRIRHVLRNLISNALHASSAGSKVIVSAQKWEETRVELSVIDTGCGIEPEEHEKIFQRHYQLTATGESRAGGQGLGLTAVQLIVELHGGQIHLESFPAQGSTFAVIL